MALRPGDQFERALAVALIRTADEDRRAERLELMRAAAVLAGQTTALCLGIDPEWVDKVGTTLIEGGE